jgi:hypothetical protein
MVAGGLLASRDVLRGNGVSEQAHGVLEASQMGELLEALKRKGYEVIGPTVRDGAIGTRRPGAQLTIAARPPGADTSSGSAVLLHIQKELRRRAASAGSVLAVLPHPHLRRQVTEHVILPLIGSVHAFSYHSRLWIRSSFSAAC